MTYNFKFISARWVRHFQPCEEYSNLKTLRAHQTLSDSQHSCNFWAYPFRSPAEKYFPIEFHRAVSILHKFDTQNMLQQQERFRWGM